MIPNVFSIDDGEGVITVPVVTSVKLEKEYRDQLLERETPWVFFGLYPSYLRLNTPVCKIDPDPRLAGVRHFFINAPTRRVGYIESFDCIPNTAMSMPIAVASRAKLMDGHHIAVLLPAKTKDLARTEAAQAVRDLINRMRMNNGILSALHPILEVMIDAAANTMTSDSTVTPLLDEVIDPRVAIMPKNMPSAPTCRENIPSLTPDCQRFLELSIATHSRVTRFLLLWIIFEQYAGDKTARKAKFKKYPEIYIEVRRLVDKRNNIAHDASSSVSDNDLDSLMTAIRIVTCREGSIRAEMIALYTLQLNLKNKTAAGPRK